MLGEHLDIPILDVTIQCQILDFTNDQRVL